MFMHICSLRRQLAQRKMSQCREDVYLEETELMARRGPCRLSYLSPRCDLHACWRACMCARVCVCVCRFDCYVCCLLTDTERWEMPVFGGAPQQTHIGCDTAEPAVWQACDRAELVLNNFIGSITLPKHWTRHLPFPIYPSWSQNPLLFTNGVLIGPNLSLSID